jgi:hypothetical protein
MTSNAIKKVKKPSTHPTYSEMIAKAVLELKERGGSSRIAILKYIMANFDVGINEVAVNAHVKMALKKGVKDGALKQVKGKGASGSFRLGDKVKKELKKAAAPPKPNTKPKSAKKAPKKAPKPKPVVKPKASKSNTSVKKSASAKKVVKTPTKNTPAKKENPKSAAKATPKKAHVKKATPAKKAPVKKAGKK